MMKRETNQIKRFASELDHLMKKKLPCVTKNKSNKKIFHQIQSSDEKLNLLCNAK